MDGVDGDGSGWLVVLGVGLPRSLGLVLYACIIYFI